MDVFIRNFIAKYTKIIKKSSRENLLKLVSAIEYTEAILEITAAKLFGHKFKWFIIFITHLAKCIIRLQLLIVHKFGVQPLPSLFTIKSILNHADPKKPINEANNQQLIKTDSIDKTFKLKHSGRVIRSIKNSPLNLEERNWSNPADESSNKCIAETDEQADITQDTCRFYAELLHITRPVCHLTTMFIFDSKSWLQFLVPLVMDTMSLFLMNGTKHMSGEQKKEMRRRTITFLHYLIRSPLYENYSSSIINVVLSQFEQRIPGARYLIKPINGYIPQWREVYNYCWTV